MGDAEQPFENKIEYMQFMLHHPEEVLPLQTEMEAITDE